MVVETYTFFWTNTWEGWKTYIGGVYHVNIFTNKIETYDIVVIDRLLKTYRAQGKLDKGELLYTKTSHTEGGYLQVELVVYDEEEGEWTLGTIILNHLLDFVGATGINFIRVTTQPISGLREFKLFTQVGFVSTLGHNITVSQVGNKLWVYHTLTEHDGTVLLKEIHKVVVDEPYPAAAVPVLHPDQEKFTLLVFHEGETEPEKWSLEVTNRA